MKILFTQTVEHTVCLLFHYDFITSTLTPDGRLFNGVEALSHERHLKGTSIRRNCIPYQSPNLMKKMMTLLTVAYQNHMAIECRPEPVSIWSNPSNCTMQSPMLCFSKKHTFNFLSKFDTSIPDNSSTSPHKCTLPNFCQKDKSK